MKVDFKKDQKDLYAPKPEQFSLIEVPCMNFLMFDGQGDPNTSQDYVAAIEALYSASYTLKFFSKQELDKDYVVPPLEGLWWADDEDSFVNREKSLWKWTMMVRVPDWLTEEQVKAAVAKAALKKPDLRQDQLRFSEYNEGLSVQIMHIGTYDEEGPTLLKVHQEFIPENGLVESGKHHEIYLGDPRKTEPSKLKTILRQPVRAKG